MTRKDIIPGAVLASAVFGLIFALSCGEPLEPRRFPWNEVCTFPENAHLTAVTSYAHGWTFIAGSVREGAPAQEYAVLYNDESGLTEIYRSPRPHSAFEDARSYFYRHCIAVGWRGSGAATKPLVVRYQGGTVTRVVEVPVAVTASSFTKVYPMNEGVYWVLGDDGVYLYEWGEWRRVAESAGANATDLAVTDGGRAFYLRVVGGGVSLALSDDRGASWLAEPVALSPARYEIDTSYDVVLEPAGETVYLAARARLAGDGASHAVIAARDGGPPGEGEFNVAFAVPVDASGTAVKKMAYVSELGGAAVGPGTSLSLRNDWHIDDLSQAMAMDFVAVCAVQGSKYYAVAYYDHVPLGRRCSLFYARR